MENFKKSIFFLVGMMFFAFIVLSFVKKESADTKTKVAVTTFALYDIVKNITHNRVEIVKILPFGVDVHSFEPTPKLMVELQNSDLVIISGAGLEPWATKFEFKNRVLDMSKYVKLRELKHHHDDEDEHHHEGVDPHYWLDVENMRLSAEILTKELVKISPKNKEFFEKNLELYLTKLKKIDDRYKQKLSACKKNVIVVNHNAFGYLADRYGFEVKHLTGLSPESEPSAKKMSQIIDFVKQSGVDTIFFESFVNNRAIKSIANESGVKIDVLQPMGNITYDEHKRGLTYSDIMQINLEKLSKALVCN